jgi:hypothetical protein
MGGWCLIGDWRVVIMIQSAEDLAITAELDSPINDPQSTTNHKSQITNWSQTLLMPHSLILFNNVL